MLDHRLPQAGLGRGQHTAQQQRQAGLRGAVLNAGQGHGRLGFAHRRGAAAGGGQFRLAQSLAGLAKQIRRDQGLDIHGGTAPRRAGAGRRVDHHGCRERRRLGVNTPEQLPHRGRKPQAEQEGEQRAGKAHDTGAGERLGQRGQQRLQARRGRRQARLPKPFQRRRARRGLPSHRQRQARRPPITPARGSGR